LSSRLKVLSGMLPEYADGALIFSNTNRRYFTEFVSSLGYLLVTKSESYLFVDSRYSEAAQKQAKNCKVVAYKVLSEEMADIISQNGLKNIMLESSAITLSECEHIEKIFAKANASALKNNELDRIINTMRVIKTSDEIEKMHRAQLITEHALTETLKLIKEGVTEKDLALELEFRMKRLGAEEVSFDLIVLAGKKTSMPHGVPGFNRVKKGDFILFDIGATYDGYHSDMTRTYAFGNIGSEQKRVYATVKQAQENALAALKDGAECGDVDSAARTYINHAGYEGYFGHSTGHGVGLDIHEVPSVSPKSDFVLRNGMVVTAEPGIYLPDRFGVRIEDMVVITNSGYMNFASMSKELIVI